MSPSVTTFIHHKQDSRSCTDSPPRCTAHKASSATLQHCEYFAGQGFPRRALRGPLIPHSSWRPLHPPRTFIPRGSCTRLPTPPPVMSIIQYLYSPVHFPGEPRNSLTPASLSSPQQSKWSEEDRELGYLRLSRQLEGICLFSVFLL